MFIQKDKIVSVCQIYISFSCTNLNAINKAEFGLNTPALLYLHVYKVYQTCLSFTKTRSNITIILKKVEGSETFLPATFMQVTLPDDEVQAFTGTP